LIELVAGALKNKEAMTKLLEFGENFFVDRKCVRRKKPLFFSEETFLREGGANCGKPVVLNSRLHYEANVQRPTPNVQRRMLTSKLDIGR